MPSPSMPGTEVAGRMFALEALLIAISSELLASLPEDKVAAVFAETKAIAHAIVDDLTPTIGATPEKVKEVGKYADDYVDSHVETISRMRVRALNDAAPKT